MSYNGSYPYAAYSGLGFDGNLDERDYDPSGYNAPANNQTPLLGFENPHELASAPTLLGSLFPDDKPYYLVPATSVSDPSINNPAEGTFCSF